MKKLIEHHGWKLFLVLIVVTFTLNIMDIFISNYLIEDINWFSLAIEIISIIGIVGLAANVRILSQQLWKVAFGINSLLVITMYFFTAMALTNPITFPTDSTLFEIVFVFSWYLFELTVYTITVYGLFVYAHKKGEIWD